jgi:hypothetical protein
MFGEPALRDHWMMLWVLLQKRRTKTHKDTDNFLVTVDMTWLNTQT